MPGPELIDLQTNRVLASLPPRELRAAQSRFRSKPLAHDAVIYSPAQRVDDLVFPLSGMLSVIREMEDGRLVEVAAITRDGMTGLPLRGDGRSLGARTLIQIEGVFAFLDVDCVSEMCRRDPQALDIFDRATQVFAATLLMTAACNRAHDVNQRLARWLLVADDAIDGPIRLTQEYLAAMVGVQRPTVTLAAGRLQDLGVIAYKRGRINVLDRRQLENMTCECHSAIAAIRDRILPPST